MADVSPKSKAVTIKLSPEQHKAISARAERCGVKPGVWMRSILSQAAILRAEQGYIQVREPNGATT
jgi:hypothetical protein